ncbi:MAG: OB-fold domain-containing protein [Myxococcales bacterium]|nr:OB-fold domain-containing protein [Myxococcales bacterium]
MAERVGIERIGVYAPPWRLGPEHFERAWGTRVRATRAVAGHDEDTLTMALEAAGVAGAEAERERIDGLYFAATRAPYAEKGAAATIATALDLRGDLFAGDFVGTLRGGTQALRAAWDAVRAGSARAVLVATSDLRLVEPGNATETTLGDGAAAVVVGTHDPLAEIVASHSTVEDFADNWRLDGETYLREADAKFIGEYGYPRILGEAIDALLAKAGVTKDAVAQVAVCAPDVRGHALLEKRLGFDANRVSGTEALARLGYTGNAAEFIALVDALSKARAGEWVVLAGFGSGADAFLLRATDAVERRRAELDLANVLEGGVAVPSYERYLQWRGILPTERIDPFTSLPVLWREQRDLLRRYAKRCGACGAIQFPPRRICWNCSVADRMEDHRLGRFGTVRTFTRDHLVPVPADAVGMIAADLEGGGRFYGQYTDGDPKEIEVGMPVELVLRRLHTGGGLIHYFWKLRKRREG